MENNSFLKILKNYFEPKAGNEILIGDKKDIVIPIEWIFTEKIDREIINRAFVDTLQEHNPRYVENYASSKVETNKRKGLGGGYSEQEQKEYYEEQAKKGIKEVVVQIDKYGIKLVINGIDGFTKAIICENPYKESKILQISENEFADKVLGVLKKDSIAELVDTLDVPEEEKEHLQTIFAQKSGVLDEFSLKGITESLAEASTNLTEYYDYLYEEKQKSHIHNITIVQRQDAKGAKTNGGGVAPDRKSPVYTFVEREKILRSMSPTHVINVDGYDQDGNLVPGVYTAFVYEKPRGNEGYLLVAEPLEGSHATRMVYLTEDKFKSFKIPEKSDRYAEVSKHYLEMSNDEFLGEKSALRVNHGPMDAFVARLEYYIEGKETEGIKSHRPYYNEKLNTLYGQKKVSKEQIARVAEPVLGDEVKTAESVLEDITKQKKPQIKGETND